MLNGCGRVRSKLPAVIATLCGKQRKSGCWVKPVNRVCWTWRVGQRVQLSCKVAEVDRVQLVSGVVKLTSLQHGLPSQGHAVVELDSWYLRLLGFCSSLVAYL